MASYRILRKLGEGGQGTVYEAEQVDLGRHVALKRLRRELRRDPVIVERFLREARMCAAVKHPNVVTIYESGADEEGPFIAFELLDGESLEERVARDGAQPFSVLGPVAEQILLALEEAHAQNLVHRDIKPANVFLTQGRRGLGVKLLDFGVAKGNRDYGSRLTMPGDVVGSLAFMAPEQVDGKAVDARTDIYSLGVCLYYMLAGVRPFVGSTTGELLLALDGPPLPVVLRRPDVPTDLGALVHKAMAKEMGRRFSSATEMLDALASIAVLQKPVRRPPRIIEPEDGVTSITEPTLTQSTIDKLRARLPIAVAMRAADLEEVTIATRGEDDEHDPFPEEEMETHVRMPPRPQDPDTIRTPPEEVGLMTGQTGPTGPTHRMRR